MANDNATTKIDQRFELPPGLEDLEYETVDELAQVEDEFDVSDESDYEDYDLFELQGDDEESEDGGVLLPPSYINVVSQQVRTLPGGGQVVDVVLDLPDLVDGIKYDIRTTIK